MSHLDFNAFYEPFLQALKIKNIYTNQFKNRNRILFYLYVLSLLVFGCSWALVSSSLKSLFLFASVSFLSAFLFFIIDKVTLKSAVKEISKRQGVKLMFPNIFEQFKYHLWKERLSENLSLFSINKALDYLDIELSKFSIEKPYNNPFYLLIFSAVLLTAFWKLIDGIWLDQDARFIVYGLVFYFSYQFIKFKLFIFESEQKKLSTFRQYLLRLKSEISQEN